MISKICHIPRKDKKCFMLHFFCMKSSMYVHPYLESSSSETDSQKLTAGCRTHALRLWDLKCLKRVTVIVEHYIGINIHTYVYTYVYTYVCTVKPHLVATSVMRPPHYSGLVQQVQTYFPLCYLYLILLIGPPHYKSQWPHTTGPNW